MNKQYIIPGYNGIMVLDISNIPKEHQSHAISQHYKDIDEYKKNQSMILPHLRYENTILHIKNKLERTQELSQKYNQIEFDRKLKYQESYNQNKF